MATTPLPEQPNLEQLRKRARELQRAIRRGDPAALDVVGLAVGDGGFRLGGAQRAIARQHGFASWPRLIRHVEAIAARSWTSPAPPEDEPLADRFVRLACLNYDSDDRSQHVEANSLLAEHPELSAAGVAAAAASANVEALRHLLGDDPAAATRNTGPFGWSPLMYATYSRIAVEPVASVATVELLLAAGGDPNDGRFFRGLPTPFTLLTGAFGRGERDQPAHPHSVDVARVLLAAGADPNDGQTLYNRMFTPDDDFLGVLFEYGLGRGDGGPWRRALPDLLPSPHDLVRSFLEWAVVHDQRDRVALLARHGVDLVGERDGSPSPIALAQRNGHRQMVTLLRELGATPAHLDPVDEFVAAALCGDTAAVQAAADDVVSAARARRPSLIVWAAAQERVEAVKLIAAAGFDVNALGRSDIPVEQPWQSALQTAVERGNAEIARRLLALGADRELRDARYGATAAQWADHFGRPDLAAMLAGEENGAGPG